MSIQDSKPREKQIFPTFSYLTIGSFLSVHYRVMEHAGSLESTKEALHYWDFEHAYTYTEFDCAALLAML